MKPEPELSALIDLARHGDEPNEDDRRRVTSRVAERLALAGRDSLEGIRVASIGPATSEVARKHGVFVDAEAQPYSIEGLVSSILTRTLPA